MTVKVALFLAITILVVPIVLVITALIFSKKQPGTINNLVGYRTKRSMESQEAWDYANRRMTTLMRTMSIIMLIASAVVGTVLFVLYLQGNMTEGIYSIIITLVILLQTVCVCLTVPVIEKELAEGKHLKG